MFRARRFAPQMPALVGGLALWGCNPTLPQPVVPTKNLPNYVEPLASIFDDGVDASAIDDVANVEDAAKDPLLPERVRASDHILELRIVTVSSFPDGGGPAFVLEFQPIESLGRRKAPTETLSVRVTRSAPSFRLVRALDAQLIGRRFTGFLREFANPEGGSSLHFHLSSNRPPIFKAVRDTLALDDVFGPSPRP